MKAEFLFALLAPLLVAGCGLSLKSAHAEELQNVWIEHNANVIREYDMTLELDSSRWRIECKRNRLQPKVGIVVGTMIDLCNAEDVLRGVAHVSIFVENTSFFSPDGEVIRQDFESRQREGRQPLRDRYAPSHPWKKLMEKNFLEGLADRAIFNKLNPRNAPGILEATVRTREHISCAPADVYHYELAVEGVLEENGESRPARHVMNVVMGFFSHTVTYTFIGEQGTLPGPIDRELYFTVVVYNRGITGDVTEEACEIIGKLSRQARAFRR